MFISPAFRADGPPCSPQTLLKTNIFSDLWSSLSRILIVYLQQQHAFELVSPRYLVQNVALLDHKNSMCCIIRACTRTHAQKLEMMRLKKHMKQSSDTFFLLSSGPFHMLCFANHSSGQPANLIIESRPSPSPPPHTGNRIIFEKKTWEGNLISKTKRT